MTENDFFSAFTMTIDGVGIDAAATLPVLNPASETVVAKAPDASREQIDDAVAAARKAFLGWRSTPVDERREALRAIATVIEDNADAFARLFTLEQGRPIDKAALEIASAAYWCREVAKLDIPVIVNEDTPGRVSTTRYLPLGVVAGIVPWNFPFVLAIWKIAPALLTGNTMVLKPSPYTPLTILKLGELLRPHLPAGVLNTVSGGDALGPWLTEHPGIDKVSFTGSSATGRRVMASAAATLKRVTLELGGNDAAIVLPDADVKKLAPILFWNAFGNSGQICIATKRMYIHDSVYDDAARAIADYAATVDVGDGLKPGSQLGPIQNRVQFDRVRDLLDDSRARGHRFLIGGHVGEGRGYFVPVTIVDNPPEDSRVVQEEAFGPVLPLIRYTDIDDVVNRANASEFGLGGSIWTADEEAGAALAARLETGTVWVNESQYVMPWTPFAGHKQSGVGVENGTEGLLAYTVPQTITARKRKPPRFAAA